MVLKREQGIHRNNILRLYRVPQAEKYRTVSLLHCKHGCFLNWKMFPRASLLNRENSSDSKSFCEVAKTFLRCCALFPTVFKLKCRGKVIITRKCVYVCVAADLRVAEGHILTQSVDVLLTGVVQLRQQADVLRLQRFTEDRENLEKTQTFHLHKLKLKTN